MSTPDPSPPAADLVMLRQAIAGRVDAIVDGYVRGLTESQSPLAALDRPTQEVTVRGMLAGLLTGDPDADPASADRGRAHARARLNPIHAVRAIQLVGTIAAGEVVEVAEREHLGPDVVATALGDLFATLTRRIVLSGGAYAVSLLGDLHTSHLNERRRIARDLHDRVAHTLAIAHQQLELRAIALDRGDQASAERHDEQALLALEDATAVVRDIGEDVGRLHTERGIVAAVEEYAELAGGGLVVVTAEVGSASTRSGPGRPRSSSSPCVRRSATLSSTPRRAG